MIQFFIAATDNDYTAARLLFTEYAASIHINLDFQHFDEELKGLQQMYSPPGGAIVLAKLQDEIIGCVGIRKMSGKVGELKRMYIKPGYQGKGIGKTLLAIVLDLARQCNYEVVRLDTLSFMLSAIHLYKQAGFYEIPAYYNNPISTAVYFEKKL